MDTPARLKSAYLQGAVWDIYPERSTDLLAGLTALETCPGVRRTGLAGDHLRAITALDTPAAELAHCLEAAGIDHPRLVLTEPTLEDIFLALASGRAQKNGREQL